MATSSLTALRASEARILVPLDGSTRAERALPIAQRLALALHRPLLLARIIPLVSALLAAPGAPVEPAVYQQLMDDELAEAHEYLTHQGRTLRRQQVVVETVINRGDPATALLDLCAERSVGLIVMTTHGRTGLARAALGNVADRLVRASLLPVLMTPAAEDHDEQSLCRALNHIVIPLDGSPVAETALPVANALAGVMAHEITLLQVISYTADASERLAVSHYLAAQAQSMQGSLAGRDCQIATAIREGVVPSEKIVQFAEDCNCLVVMATHGRSGFRRLTLGSVAAEVIHGSRLPVLVTRPTSPGNKSDGEQRSDS